MNDQEFAVIKKAANLLVAKRYTGRLYEAGDLYAAGWEGVVEYHAKFGDDFQENLMGKIVRRRMIDHVRSLRKLYSTTFSEPFTFTDIEFSHDGEYEVGIIGADNSFTEMTLSKEAFEDIIKVLQPSERNMVRMHIDAELNYREIAEIIGVCEARVCQIFNGRIYPTIQKAITK